jgi:outer membrane lipoprotein-sorting protein
MERVPREIGLRIVIMRVRILFAALLTCASVSLTAQTTVSTVPSADEVMARLFARDLQRNAAADGYTGTRQYDLENRMFSKRSRVVANIACDPDGTMHFRVVSKDGWRSGNNSLHQALETESEISRPQSRPRALITTDNYTFQMVGTALLNGRMAYVLDAVPKREETYLFRGKIWVDAQDYALARIEGELAKTPSFWIRRVSFTLEFRKSGEYWFPWSSTSTSDVRVFGPTDVNIRFFDYYARSEAAGDGKNPAFAEAHYAKP